MEKKMILGIVVLALIGIFSVAKAFKLGGTGFVPEKYGVYTLSGIEIPLHSFAISGFGAEFNVTESGFVPTIKQSEAIFIFYTGEKLTKDVRPYLGEFCWQEEGGYRQRIEERRYDLKGFPKIGCKNISYDIFPNYAGNSGMFRLVPKVVLPPGYYAFYNGYDEGFNFFIPND